jgi:hypothetical protein
VVGLANGGADSVNCIKQAAEFGLIKADIKIVGVGLLVHDIAGIGLETPRVCVWRSHTTGISTMTLEHSADAMLRVCVQDRRRGPQALTMPACWKQLSDLLSMRNASKHVLHSPAQLERLRSATARRLAYKASRSRRVRVKGMPDRLG